MIIVLSLIAISLCEQIQITRKLGLGSLQGSCTTPSANNLETLGLSNCNNNLYMATIGIGTPSQNFSVQFDTGSNILWIPTQGCSNCPNPSFIPSSSSTYNNPNNNQMSISYAGGSTIAGSYGSDLVSFFGSSLLNVNSGILFVSSQSDYTSPANGIIGLGFSDQYPNIFDLAYSQNKISTSTFSLDLTSQNDYSVLYYNGLPSSVTNGIYYLKHKSNNLNVWEVQSIGVQIGGVDFSSYASSSLIVDSGTSLFYLNPTLYMNVYETFFSSCTMQGSYLSCNCSQITIPTIKLYLKGIALYIYPANYTTVNIFTKQCRLNFGSASQNYILMGDTLFRNYIITFDKQNSKVGFTGNYTEITLIGQTAQTYLQVGQITMAAICALLIIAAVAMLCVMWRGQKPTRKDSGIEAELRNYSAY